MDRKQYIKELRWTPQISEGFLYIDLIFHRHVHLIMHTLISISAHIHMKHKKWYVTCVGAKYKYIYIHVSQLASASFLGSKVHINIAIFLYSYYSKNVLVFALSLHFSNNPPPPASLKHFRKADSEAVPNDFTQSIVFGGGIVFI